MYQLLAKRGQLLAIAVGALVTAIYLITVFGGLSSNGYSVSDDLVQVLKGDTNESFGFFDLGLKLSAALVIIPVVIAVLFGVYHLLSNLKGSLKGLIGMAVIALVFFALYNSASVDLEQGNAISDTLQKFNVTANVSKLIEGGIKTTTLMAALAAAGIFLLEIYNMFK